MKKALIILCTLILMLSCLGASVFSEGRQYIQIVPVDMGYASIEAEEAVRGVYADIKSEAAFSSGASGGKYVEFTQPTAAIAPENTSSNPALRFDFKIQKPAEYAIWLRVYTPTDGSNSAYISVNSGEYVNKSFKALNDWQWYKLGSYAFERGVSNVSLKYRERLFRIDKLIITADATFSPADKNSLPEELSYEAIPSQLRFDVSQVIKPIEGHPRVFITPEYIEKLKEYVKTPELSKTWSSVVSSAGKSIVSLLPPNKSTDENGNEIDLGSYNSSTLNSIQCRALLYAMGEKGDDYAKETIKHARNYLATVTFNESTGDITRQKGMVMTMGAIVYDWCYDHMTESDKAYFIKRFKEICAIKEIKYPPSATIHALGGHMDEYEVHRDMLSCGIACYDEDPQLYDYASGIIFNRYREARRFLNQSKNHPVGNDYGQFRTMCESYADFLYSRMYPEMEHIYGEDFGSIPLRFLYARLPDGMFMKDGDSYSYSSRYRLIVHDGTYGMYMMVGNLYGEPYARGEYLRQQSIGGYTKENFWTLIFANPEADSKLMTDLPLSYATTYPATSIFARTGWQTGIDSATAVCHMKSYERTVWDHMHADNGHFNLYYKGTLALDAGSYQGYDPVTGNLLDYGSSHDYNFNKKSIAHNVVTVTNPSESFGKYENDGGQKRPESASGSLTNYEELISENGLRSETKGLYIGPNSQTPAFSYLKTDITKAYTAEKMESNVRQMVFMDMFDEDYPAALIVFDRVVSTNASFKKKWNLNSIEKPQISGNLTTIKRTEHGYNGKLVNKTLLPEEISVNLVEGCTVNGTDYTIIDKNANDWHATEQGTWRIEVSPARENKEDLFLNAMYVTDADSGNPQLEMKKIESGNFVGVSVQNRLVMFKKDCGIQENAFTLNIPSNETGKTLCLISDLKTGTWSISGLNINVECKPGENAIVFEAPSGTFTLSPTSSAPTPVSFPEQPKPQIGDFQIYFNNQYSNEQFLMNCTIENIEKDGVGYVPVRTIFERMNLYSKGKAGAEFVAYDDATSKAKFQNNSGDIIEIYAGMTSYTYNSKTVKLSDVVFEKGGTMYASVADFKDFLNLSSVSYDSLAKLLKVTTNK